MASISSPDFSQRGYNHEEVSSVPQLPPGTQLRALRLWGQASHLVETRSPRYGPRSKTDFNIEITSHEFINVEVADGTARDPAVLIPPVSLAQASQHTKIRQDKNSEPSSSNPFVQITWNEREDGDYRLVLVCLFDRAGAQGDESTTTYSRHLQRPVPDGILATIVDSYLQQQGIPPKPAVLSDSPRISLPIHMKTAASDKPPSEVRGRRRRQNRRHGFYPAGAFFSSNEPYQTRDEKPLPIVEVCEDDELLFRGRAKRQQRRNKLHGRKSEQVLKKRFHHGKSQPTSQPTEPPPPISINLEHRLPATWKGAFCVHVLGPTQDDFSDAILVPLSISDDRQHLSTSLAFAKSFMQLVERDIPPFIESGEQPPTEVYDPPEWMPRLARGMPQIRIDALRLGGGLSNQGNLSYWQKFPLSAVGHLREDEWHKRSARETDFFNLSRWLSFGCPQITYADQEGSLPSDLDYAKLFVCDRSIFAVGRTTAAFPTWMGEISKLWYDEQNDLTEGFSRDLFKVTNTSDPYHKADSTTGQLNANRKLGGLLAQAGSYSIALREFEARMEHRMDFSRPFNWRSEKHSRKGAGTPQDVKRGEPPALPSEFDPASTNELIERLDRTQRREIWYCPWEKSHIPFWQQEQTLKRIKTISTSNEESLADFVKAHATFEYGLCLLNGFGTEQNINSGLLWIRRAAELGSRLASAIVPCLWRAYGHHSKSNEDNDRLWTMQEAIWLSPYAQLHLETLLPESYESIRRNMLYTLKYSIDWPFEGAYTPDEDESQFMHFFVKEVVGKLAMNDPPTLKKQLHFEDPALWDLLAPLISKDATPETLALFFRAMMRWACCHGEVELMRELMVDGLGLIDSDDLEEFLMLTVHRGHGRLTWYLLEKAKSSGLSIFGTDSSQSGGELGFNMLFLLHHFSDTDVGHMVQKFVGMGFDVNEKAPIDKVRRQATYPCRPDDSSWSVTHRTWDLHLHDDIRGFSITPLRWAIVQNKAGLVRALLNAGAKFPLIPPKRISETLSLDAWAPDARTVAVLDQPCYNTEILALFFEVHGNQEQPVFAESPLGLIAMEPNSPMRRLRVAQQIGDHRDALFPVLALLRRYQPGNDAELFWAAAMHGHEDIVRYLISEGISTEVRWKGLTPLHTSILYGRRDIFTLLLHNRADVFATTTDREISAMHLVFWRPKPAQTELFMLEKLHTRLYGVAGKHGKFGHSVTPLHLAVLNSRPEVVQRLVDLGADATAVLGQEIMPSILGCQFTAEGIENQSRYARAAPSGLYGSVQVPYKPIEIKGYTAAGIVLLREDMFLPKHAAQILKSLLAAASPKKRSIEAFYTRPDIQQTALHLLVWNPLRETTDLLDWVLERGQKVDLTLNTKDAHGDTPLHYGYAIQGPRFTRAIDDLTHRGASPSQANDLLLTPPSMRAAALSRLAPESGPLEIHMSLYLPPIVEKGEARPSNEPPADLAPMARLFWELEEKVVTPPVVWDCKTRTMVTLPPQSAWSPEGLQFHDREDGFEVALKKPGWRDVVEEEKYKPSDMAVNTSVLISSSKGTKNKMISEPKSR